MNVRESIESPVADARRAIREAYARDEAEVVRGLAEGLELGADEREAISERGARLVQRVRDETSPTMMEAFLSEYGLSTEEGIGLMCLAEALLRTPDAETIDELIHDKIEPSDWGAHLGHSSSPLVNASTWGLMLTGRVLDDDPKKTGAALRRLIRRLGEPVIRTAVGQSMKILGQQFVLAEDIETAIDRAKGMEEKGYTYSYDMLGEAARTEADAKTYHDAYAHAIDVIRRSAKGDVRSSPGISVKLSALHPRYETHHRDAIEDVIIPRTLELAKKAASDNIGFNIDAEEQDRLDVSLDVIEAVLADDALKGWDGFGIVVQAYGRRSVPVLRHLYALAEKLDRKIMVRLVKGAYWDTEIKLAQELGVKTFPVFTRKVNTDLCYLACAKMLCDMRDRIYPQFATHNAHSVAAVLRMAGNDKDSYEFQRLHGMGESLHEIVRETEGTRCRIYAPVGEHKDLLAYLVRRLLENGANSSFVNQIVDESISPEEIAADPYQRALGNEPIANPSIRPPEELFAPRRKNSKGYRLEEPASIDPLIEAREAFAETTWTARPLTAAEAEPEGEGEDVTSPADRGRVVGKVFNATEAEVKAAQEAAHKGFETWSQTPAGERADILRKVADLYEENYAELCAIATREAGKTLSDGIAEVREACDFLRYYACEAERLEEEEPGEPRGVFVCISPWNFPLAIFTGQISAALAAGNAVLAKPAEQTPMIATRAVELMREAGVPADVLQLLPGDGPMVGAPLTSDPKIAGVCFTGSTETAQIIHKALAENAGPDAILIAETGGLNAMIVDSTALPEQAVHDIVISAFQSAGQRCSALRVLYVQEEARERVQKMLFGAMDALAIGDPWRIEVDVAPVIDGEAEEDIAGYIAKQKEKGHLLKHVSPPEADGSFVGPAVIAVEGINDVEREVFGPVLHITSFDSEKLDAVVDDINARGFGLTFGMHTRIDDRVQQVVERIHVGNSYINRNQIGAIVGSQPFGGEGLSGTGPKAGGPHYVNRFRRTEKRAEHAAPETGHADRGALEQAIAALDARSWAARGDRLNVLRRALQGEGGVVKKALNAAAAFDTGPFDLPGPTGESNRLSLYPKGTVLCLGLTTEIALAQAVQALYAGCPTVVAAPGAEKAVKPLRDAGVPVAAFDASVAAETLETLDGVVSVAAAGASDWTAGLRRALARREGPIVPLETAVIYPARYFAERHLCIDTTAAGGNARLLAQVD